MAVLARRLENRRAIKNKEPFFASIYDVGFNVFFGGNYENCISCLLYYFTVLSELIIS
jgi:hypothetical protein